METVEKAPARRGVSKWLIPALGYTVSAASLIWVLSRFPYAQFGYRLRTIDRTWVAVAVVIELLVYFADAWRWAVLLRPVGAPSFKLCLQSVFVGSFANDVLPARAGELVRCFLLSYETEVPLSLALTSDVILRVMDGVWIVLIYLLVTFQIGNHAMVTRAMWIVGTVVVVIAALTLYVLFRRGHAHHFVKNRSWAARFIHLLDEVHRLGQWPELRLAMLGSGFYWLAQILAMWALARADAFDFGIGAAAFLLLVKAVGTLIPGAPANVGAYQAAIVYGLQLLLSEHGEAQIFSEIAFGVLTLPVAAAGAIAVAFMGVDITELHRHARDARKRPHTAAP
jgi:glycosyltransferase 2 family protein